MSKPNFDTFTNKTFRNLLDDDDFTDVTLACDDGQLVKAHKVILAAASTFFKRILGQAAHPNPLVHIQGIKAFHLRLMLDFIYLGRISIERGNIEEFFETTRSLRIEGLEEVLEFERKSLLEEKARELAERVRIGENQSHENENPRESVIVKRLYSQLVRSQDDNNDDNISVTSQQNQTSEIPKPSTNTKQNKDNEEEKTQSAKWSKSDREVDLLSNEVKQETSHLEENMLYEENQDHNKSLNLEEEAAENLENLDGREDDAKEVSDMASDVDDWGYAKPLNLSLLPEPEEIVHLKESVSENESEDGVAEGGADLVDKLREEETKKKYNLRSRRNTSSDDVEKKEPRKEKGSEKSKRQLSLNPFHDVNNGRRRPRERKQVNITPREKLNQKRENISGPFLRRTRSTVRALQVLNCLKRIVCILTHI